MSLFTIADLHLPLSKDKPMDIFKGWDNYVKKLENNWNSVVSNEDTVVVPGDISWATYLENSYEDFKFINELKGRKIILKGNHDYWFATHNKINKFLEENGFNTVEILHNSFKQCGNVAICGTKSYDTTKPPETEQELKIENRECLRLENSIIQAEKEGFDEIYVFLHYPPIIKYGKYNRNPVMEILEKHQIKKCFYGHLHNLKTDISVNEIINGTEFKLIASDYLGFMPYKIL